MGKVSCQRSMGNRWSISRFLLIFRMYLVHVAHRRRYEWRLEVDSLSPCRSNAASDAFELFHLGMDPSEAIDLASYYPDKVAELDRLIAEHLQATDALLPIRNANYKGNPRSLRTNMKKAKNRPQKLKLEDTTIQTTQAGKRRVQLMDEKGNARDTHALVLKGQQWVRVENRIDGSVEVIWKRLPRFTRKDIVWLEGRGYCF